MLPYHTHVVLFSDAQGRRVVRDSSNAWQLKTKPFSLYFRPMPCTSDRLSLKQQIANCFMDPSAGSSVCYLNTKHLYSRFEFLPDAFERWYLLVAAADATLRWDIIVFQGTLPRWKRGWDIEQKDAWDISTLLPGPPPLAFQGLQLARIATALSSRAAKYASFLISRGGMLKLINNLPFTDAYLCTALVDQPMMEPVKKVTVEPTYYGEYFEPVSVKSRLRPNTTSSTHLTLGAPRPGPGATNGKLSSTQLTLVLPQKPTQPKITKPRKQIQQRGTDKKEPRKRTKNN